MVGHQEGGGDDNRKTGWGQSRQNDRTLLVGGFGVRVVKMTEFFWCGARRWLGCVPLLIALTSITACRGPAPAGPSRWRLALTPASFANTISLQQHVQVEQAGRNVDFEAVLDITPDTVTLVGLAFNQRVFTLTYDGVKLRESRSKMLPREVQAGDVLSDMQLALWPTEVVRSALPGGWSLRDSSGTRVLLESDTIRTTISYSADPRWTGTITLENKQYNYRLVIRSAVSN